VFLFYTACEELHKDLRTVAMNFPYYLILAHGALGWWDELIFLGIITLFVGIMIFSWFQSRGDNFEATDLMPEPKINTETSERFELE
jgi:hypothetical protein